MCAVVTGVQTCAHPISAIRGRAVTLDLESQTVCVPTIPEEDEETNIVLDKVWDIYKDFGAWALRDKTHEPGTPWTVVYEEEGRGAAIPDHLIAQHFQEKIQQYVENAKRSRTAREGRGEEGEIGRA